MNKGKKIRRLIVDADFAIYKSAMVREIMCPVYAPGEEPWFETGMEGAMTYPQYITLTVDPKEVWMDFWSTMDDLKAEYKADDLLVTITDSAKNFRLDIDPTYKGNRKHTRKPLALKWVRDELAKRDDVYFKPTLEADDICGILLTLPRYKDDDVILYSQDKDLLGIPGQHTGHTPDPSEIRTVTREDADKWHLLQAVAGDVTDGYPGIKGVGEKTGAKWFDAHEWTFESALELAATKMTGRSPEYIYDFLIRQARLAKMLEHEWYDFDNEEPILWTPPPERST